MIQEAFSAGASQVFNKATLTPRQILDALHLLLSGKADGGTNFLGGASRTSNTGTPRPANDPFGLGESTYHFPPTDAGSPPPPSNYVYARELSGATGAPPPFSNPPEFQNTNPQPDLSPLRGPFTTDDTAFQQELAQAFINARPDTLAGLRKLLHEFTKATDEKTREPHLVELYRKVHALTGNAGIAGFAEIAQIAAALEVLLKELSEKPKNINASTLRTVAHSIDFIGELFKVSQPSKGDPPPANILVVDDEILSRRAIAYALEKANLRSTNVEESSVALQLASEQVFDLIFLDVQMPGMDGFELCSRIRAQPINKNTPIIFVTSLTDFKSRAKSSLSGGTDLIAKPFMFIELTVKAITQVLRYRLMPKKQAA